MPNETFQFPCAFTTNGAAATGLANLTAQLIRMAKTGNPPATASVSVSGISIGEVPLVGVYYFSVGSLDSRTYNYVGTIFAGTNSVDVKAVSSYWTQFSPAAAVALPDAAPDVTGGIFVVGSTNNVRADVRAAGGTASTFTGNRLDVGTAQSIAAGGIGASAFTQAAADKVWDTTTRSITGGTVSTGVLTSTNFASTALAAQAVASVSGTVGASLNGPGNVGTTGIILGTDSFEVLTGNLSNCVGWAIAFDKGGHFGPYTVLAVGGGTARVSGDVTPLAGISSFVCYPPANVHNGTNANEVLLAAGLVTSTNGGGGDTNTLAILELIQSAVSK